MALPKTATCRSPFSSARSRPRSLGTSTGSRERGVAEVGRPARSTSSAASASCGTQRGCTKLVASTTGRPASSRRRTNSAFVAVGHQRRLVLQAVAGADLVDRHPRRAGPGRGTTCGSAHQRTSSSRGDDLEEDRAQRHLVARPRRRTDATVPSSGAVSDSSIFIASSTPRTSPGATRLTLGHPDLEHRAGHRCEHGAVAGGDRGVVEHVGDREHGAVAAVDDLDPVRGHVDDGPVAAAVHASAPRRAARRGAGRTGTPSTRPVARSTTTGRSSSTTTGAGSAPSRQPSPWKGCAGGAGSGGDEDLGPGREEPGDVGRPARRPRRCPARPCRCGRRGTPRSRPAPAGSRRWWSAPGSRCRPGRRPAPAGPTRGPARAR